MIDNKHLETMIHKTNTQRKKILSPQNWRISGGHWLNFLYMGLWTRKHHDWNAWCGKCGSVRPIRDQGSGSQRAEKNMMLGAEVVQQLRAFTALSEDQSSDITLGSSQTPVHFNSPRESALWWWIPWHTWETTTLKDPRHTPMSRPWNINIRPKSSRNLWPL